MSTVRPTLDTTFATLPEALELSLEDEPPRRATIARRSTSASGVTEASPRSPEPGSSERSIFQQSAISVIKREPGDLLAALRDWQQAGVWDGWVAIAGRWSAPWPGCWPIGG